MSTPLISIGIIFKNDIRSIERCLKALQPLRDAIPSELVMADTGATDGSREIAEIYADILIDFPWTDDFAAARNSVMDCASGLWFFSVDTDEYLDEEVSELTAFLRESKKRSELLATVNVRNYSTYEMDGDYSDFFAVRLVRMSTGVRYEGAIHEHFCFNQSEVVACPLNHTILHHDGYVAMRQNSEEGKAKQERNVRMLRKSLKKSPDNLLLCMQLMEAGSSASMPDYTEHLRRTVGLVKAKASGWERLGPPILRHVLYSAEALSLPEWEEWMNMAEEWFPDSIFIRLDGQYAAFAHYWNTGKAPEEALRRGRLYLQALEDYRNGADPMAQLMSPLRMASPFSECTAKISLISAYCNSDQVKAAFELVKSLDYSLLDKIQIASLMGSLQDVHFKSELDTSPVLLALWEEVNRPKRKQTNPTQRKSAFLQMAAATFLEKNRRTEQEKHQFVRPAYTLYLPLQDICDLGKAAAVMEMENASAIEAMLGRVANWNDFSIHALMYALEQGAGFPLANRTMPVEEMDQLACRLSENKERFLSLALTLTAETDAGNWQRLVWIRALLMAAIGAYPWSSWEQDEEQGMAIARSFVRVEKEFLPRCYAAEVLQEDQLFALPPLHRFGFYCAQAFDALEQQKAAEYVRLLRLGLDACKDMKPMVEFLVDNTEQIQQILIPPELRALADQVRAILARFDPDNPAVVVLKQSETYQKVAYLIEKASVLASGQKVQ